MTPPLNVHVLSRWLVDNVCACRSGVILTTGNTHSSLKMLLKVKKKVHLFQDKVLDRLPIRRRFLFKSVHVGVNFYLFVQWYIIYLNKVYCHYEM